MEDEVTVLNKAVEIFRAQGEGQTGRLVDPSTGKVCLVGAVCRAMGATDEEMVESTPKVQRIVSSEMVNGLHALAQEMFPDLKNDCECCPAKAWTVNDNLGYEAALTLLEKAAMRESERVA